MFSQLLKRMGRKLSSNNEFLISRSKQYFDSGKYFKAAAFTLMTMPFSKALSPDKIYSFMTSPEYYDELQDLLKIGKAKGQELVRIGSSHDGGYIMLDDFSGGIAYSFGIANEVSWDSDMTSRGYDVFMYDHTIDGLPEEKPHFHWSKLGIADGVTRDDRLKTLEELISRNGHEGKRDMILKMDVEGAEWGFLESVKPETLSQFSQITFEIHSIINPSNPELLLNGLRKLNNTHQLVHLHANNLSCYITAGGKTFCNDLEASYVLRSKYTFVPDYDVNLPLKLDTPNEPESPELELGYWNRKTEIGGRFSFSPGAFFRTN